jgi:hypothetical protein
LDVPLAFSTAEPARTDGGREGRVFFRKEQRLEPLLPLVACVCLCVCDYWTQRKVTMDTEKSDGKKKSDDGCREK